MESFKIKGVKENTVIHEDNLPAINLAHNEQTKGRTKHLSIKMKFVQQNLQLGNIHLVHISSVNNTADLLTKALSKNPFLRHRNSLVISLFGSGYIAGTRGSVGKVFEDAFGTGQKSEDGRPASVKLSQKGVPEYTDMQPIDEGQLQGEEYPFRPMGCFDA